MRAYRKPSYAALAVGIALAVLATRASADFHVTEVSARVAADSLMVSGTLDLRLSAKVEEALSKGIPLEVVIELGLYRARRLLWDQRIQKWVLRRRISYHALSRQYLVSGNRSDRQAIETFSSLQTALVNMGTLDDLKLALKHPPKQERTKIYVGVRASLDLDALPAALRPVAYTSFSWHLTSGWTKWPLKQ
jgi:hypothetical protein